MVRDLIIQLIKGGIWTAPEEISVGYCHVFLKRISKELDLSSYIPRFMSKFSVAECSPGWTTLTYLMGHSDQRARSILEFFFGLLRDEALKCCIIDIFAILFLNYDRSRFDAKPFG